MPVAIYNAVYRCGLGLRFILLQNTGISKEKMLISSRKQALLISIETLWITLTTLPQFDSYFPLILSVPMTEITAAFMGLVMIVCFYALLAVTYGGHSKIGFQTTLIFLFLTSLLAVGLGIHVSSVTVQNQLRETDAVYSLVAVYLHRLWSHNMFQVAYFGILLLLIWSEAKRTGHPCVDTSKKNGSTHLHRERPTSTVPPHATVALESANDAITWTWAVVMGGFYSIFANNTFTVLLTMLFQAIVLGGVLAWQVRLEPHKRRFGFLWNSSTDLYITRITARVSTIGILLLGVLQPLMRNN